MNNGESHIRAMHNTAPKYKIVFSGNLLDDTPKALVAQRFGRAFKVKDDKLLNKVFSGAAVTLKRGLAHNQADDYRELLAKLGADCCIELDQQGFTDYYPETDREYERKKRQKLAELSSDQLKNATLTPKD
ncbi:MAG: hypothetical protein KTR20_04640 [Cellvibrionaceae bacterium]|nr:hypothetical protein [Cellvibrionaceae bacterium]